MTTAIDIAGAGVGLRGPHVADVMATRPAIPWFEVHAENYFGAGAALRSLEVVRRDYPVSLHGVGLSLGSAEGLDERHLTRLATLAERIEPVFVSEHLSWCQSGGAYLNHLLPLPYTSETLDVLRRHVDLVQSRLRRRVLIENPSSYLRFRHSTMSEPELLGELVQRTGCGLLCDVNNVFVSARNLDLDPHAYLTALPAHAVLEIHLAGHATAQASAVALLIDDHGSRVCAPVWDLYAEAIARFGAVPTLIEWDTNLPPLEILLDEARCADARAALARSGRAYAA